MCWTHARARPRTCRAVLILVLVFLRILLLVRLLMILIRDVSRAFIRMARARVESCVHHLGHREEFPSRTRTWRGHKLRGAGSKPRANHPTLTLAWEGLRYSARAPFFYHSVLRISPPPASRSLPSRDRVRVRAGAVVARRARVAAVPRARGGRRGLLLEGEAPPSKVLGDLASAPSILLGPASAFSSSSVSTASPARKSSRCAPFRPVGDPPATHVLFVSLFPRRWPREHGHVYIAARPCVPVSWGWRAPWIQKKNAGCGDLVGCGVCRAGGSGRESAPQDPGVICRDCLPPPSRRLERSPGARDAHASGRPWPGVASMPGRAVRRHHRAGRRSGPERRLGGTWLPAAAEQRGHGREHARRGFGRACLSHLGRPEPRDLPVFENRRQSRFDATHRQASLLPHDERSDFTSRPR